MVLGASGVAIYGGVVASLAFIVAAISLGWNITNTVRERRARRQPDVHAALLYALQGGNSELAFANAGPGMARHLFFLPVENGDVYQGGVGTPFLASEERATVPLPFSSSSERSTFVWAYMDADHNVHARSNGGKGYVYEHPARVELGEVFQRLYPTVALPQRPTLPLLGEL